ncbi:hypothetical protein R3Q06_31460 [Rhodococcus erythropolis]|nr:hypothetical protein [Rhodococcus erythropolis]MDV6278004.1 hypothetical protein [Rhodococcus erythropolis]
MRLQLRQLITTVETIATATAESDQHLRDDRRTLPALTQSAVVSMQVPPE